MMGLVGLGLTGMGTVLAIAPPTLLSKWSGKKTWRQERNRRIYYHAGTTLIVLGTILQLAEGLKTG